MSKISVLVLAFNRPELVAKVMGPIRDYQPERLYLACDGPRANNMGDFQLVTETQKTMMHAVDWPCEVKTLFREKNLGCAHAVYEAISWFFGQEEYGIIIEDDVVVGQDFFKLCEDLLPRYAEENRIMEIAAQNHSGRADINNSYVFTHNSQCWGWASWRRAWSHMDMSMIAVNQLSISSLIMKFGIFRGLMKYYYFMSAYKQLETFNSWATRWSLSILAHSGLVICPGVNLAINIGINGGTHFEKGDINPYANLKIGKIAWPLVYNDNQIIDKRQKSYDSRDFFQVRMIGLRKLIKKALHNYL